MGVVFYPYKFYINEVPDLDNPVNVAFKKFENNPNIKAITENIAIHEKLEFCIEELSNICKEILNLSSNKNGTFKNITAKYLKENIVICDPQLTKIWNKKIINHQQFPNKLKTADVTPFLKKENKTTLKN